MTKKKNVKKLKASNLVALVAGLVGFVLAIVGMFLDVLKCDYVDGILSETLSYKLFASFGDIPEMYDILDKTFVSFWAVAFEVLIIAVLVAVVFAVVLKLAKQKKFIKIVDLMIIILLILAIVSGCVFFGANKLNILSWGSLDWKFAIGGWFMVVGSAIASISCCYYTLKK